LLARSLSPSRKMLAGDAPTARLGKETFLLLLRVF
jgi:hypothetical protein